jgi:hypothetical protein
MTALKSVSPAGLLRDVNDNFAALAPLNSMIGLGNLRVARFEFDAAGVDSAGVSNKTTAAHGTGVFLPIHAIVVGGFVDVNTKFDSDATDAGTIAISVQAANDIISAAAVSGAPYSTVGRKAIIPKANTPESTSVKTTAEREITCTVAIEALLSGKLTGYLYFLDGIASA